VANSLIGKIENQASLISMSYRYRGKVLRSHTQKNTTTHLVKEMLKEFILEETKSRGNKKDKK